METEKGQAEGWGLPTDVDVPEGEASEVKEFQTLEEAQGHIGKLVDQGNLVGAADTWKRIDYTVGKDEDLHEAVRRLRLVCKVRDGQMQNLRKQMKSVEILKGCIELKNGEILKLMADYEDMKSKYMLEHGVKGKELNDNIRKLEEKVQFLQQEIVRKELFLKDKEQETKMLQESARILQGSAEQVYDQRDGLLQIRERKIAELESQLKGTSRSTPRRPDKAEAKSDVVAATPAKSNEVLVATLSKENAQNRALIREILNTKQGPDAETVRRLYSEKTELTDAVKKLHEDSERVTELLRDVALEHEAAVMKLKEMAQKAMTPRKIPEGKTLVERAERELENAKEIHAMSEQVVLAYIQEKKTVAGETKAAGGEAGERLKATQEAAKEGYRNFFADERLAGVSMDVLLDRLKRKNAAFKEVFSVCERLGAAAEFLLIENGKLKAAAKMKGIDLAGLQISSDTAVPRLLGSPSNNPSDRPDLALGLPPISGQDELSRCKALEEELLSERERHFQFEKQREECMAQRSTIEALISKLARAEESLRRTQDEYRRAKRAAASTAGWSQRKSPASASKEEFKVPDEFAEEHEKLKEKVRGLASEVRKMPGSLYRPAGKYSSAKKKTAEPDVFAMIDVTGWFSTGLGNKGFSHSKTSRRGPGATQRGNQRIRSAPQPLAGQIERRVHTGGPKGDRELPRSNLGTFRGRGQGGPEGDRIHARADFRALLPAYES